VRNVVRLLLLLLLMLLLLPRRLAEASLDCVVLERFGSKALRIFRYFREKKYMEEGSLQAVVMIPTNETKMLTYQLLENHFMHLQELARAGAVEAKGRGQLHEGGGGEEVLGRAGGAW